MEKFKVRFNLGRGQNYMKWKIQSTKTNEVIYLDPNETFLTLNNCILYNNEFRSEEIFLGASKSVCSWVLCESYSIGQYEDFEKVNISYNPRKNPHWIEDGVEVDGKFYETLKIINNKLYRKL